jgi:hypothetical protein
MLDFPKVLAEQVTRVRMVYLELNQDSPTAHLLNAPQSSDLPVLLSRMSSSLRTSEEKHQDPWFCGPGMDVGVHDDLVSA